jgi:predicted ribonuclease YlaK
MGNMVGVAGYSSDPPIEICPISFINGRTFKNSILIVDEAHTLNREELLTILTRIGENSKILILGDTSKRDTMDDGMPETFEKGT